jgi:hypothetical protein
MRVRDVRVRDGQQVVGGVFGGEVVLTGGGIMSVRGSLELIGGRELRRRGMQRGLLRTSASALQILLDRPDHEFRLVRAKLLHPVLRRVHPQLDPQPLDVPPVAHRSSLSLPPSNSRMAPLGWIAW